MRIVFMGTPEFAVPSLTSLAQTHEVVQVITRPDAVRARGKKQTASPVCDEATRLGIPVIKTARIDSELLCSLKALKADICCVAAFGCFLQDEVLEAFNYGCINVHASLLPRWRGAAPIQRAILAGDKELGVSIMKIVHELDAGPWCRQARTSTADKSCLELTSELAHLGAEELLHALNDIEEGSCDWIAQNEEFVSFAPKIDKREMLLKPQDSTSQNLLRIQASLDTSPARCMLAGRGVRLMRAREASVPLEPGQLLCRQGHLLLGCCDGAIEVVTLKPDGKREMSAAAFVAGLHESHTTWEYLG